MNRFLLSAKEFFSSGSILLFYVLEYKTYTIGGLFLGLIVSGSMLVTPLFARGLIDGGPSEGSLLVSVIPLFVILSVGAICGWLQTVLLGTVAQKIVFDARTTSIRRLFASLYSEVRGFSPGEIVTRIVSDTLLLREAATSSVVNLFNGLVMTAATLGFMLYMNYSLAVVTILLLLIISSVQIFILPKISILEAESQESVAKLGSGIESYFRALRTVKAVNGESYAREELESHCASSRSHSIKSVKISALALIVSNTGVQFLLLATLGIGGLMINSGQLTLGSLVAFMLYSLNLSQPVSNVVSSLTQIQSGLAASKRLNLFSRLGLERRFLNEQTDNIVDASVHNPGSGGIKLDGVGFDYSIAEVGSANSAATGFSGVREVTFQIPATGHTALVGPSGGGKSTVFLLLLQLLQLQTGSISIGDKDYRELPLEWVRNNFGFVDQEFPILPGSLRQNVAFGSPDVSDQQIWTAIERASLKPVLERRSIDLETDISDQLFSGGERQRIAIARALLREPRYLLLDEATAQLDARTEAEIRSTLQALSSTMSIVSIAHRLSTVVSADRIVMIEDGAVTTVGNHVDLMKRSRTYREFVSEFSMH